MIAANLANLLAPAAFMIFASVLYLKYKDTPSLKGTFNMVRLVVFAMIISAAFQTIGINQLNNLQLG